MLKLTHPVILLQKISHYFFVIIIFSAQLVSCGKTITEDERLPHVSPEVAENLCAGVECAPSEDRCRGVGTCNPENGECVYVPLDDGVSCEDGNVCSVNDTCQSGVCTSGTPRVCDAVSQCHEVLTCDPVEGCRQGFKEEGASCDDQNPCTDTSTCNGVGQCLGEVKTCPTRDCYGTGFCNPANGQCEYVPDNQQTCELDQALPCEEGACFNGECKAQPVSCDDSGDSCQVNLCNPASGECEPNQREVGATCNDQNPCTHSDQCDAEGVCVGESVICDVPSADADCRENGRCDPQTGDCKYDYLAPDECSDGNLCHLSGICLGGVCVTEPKRCPITSALECKVIECNELNGNCEAIGNQPPMVSCNTDVCQLNQVCDGEGTCVEGTRELSCPPSDQCNIYEACDAEAGCQYRLREGSQLCDDGDPCTLDDRCEPRDPTDPSPLPYQCMGTPKLCPTLEQDPEFPENFCRDATGSCNSVGACEYPLKEAGSDCDDFDECTDLTTCSELGECVGMVKDCSQDGDSPICRVRECVSPGGVCEDVSSARTNGNPCDDELFCFTQDTCLDGECNQSLPIDCSVPSEYVGVFDQGRCSEMGQACFFTMSRDCEPNCSVQLIEDDRIELIGFEQSDDQNDTKRRLYYNYRLNPEDKGESVVAIFKPVKRSEVRSRLVLLGGRNGLLLMEVSSEDEQIENISVVTDRIQLELNGEPVSLSRIQAFALEDLNGDGLEDVIIVSSSALYILTARLVDQVIKYSLTDRKLNLQRLSTAAIVDVDSDGGFEVIVGRLSGSISLFQLTTEGEDIIFDGEEIALTDLSGRLLSVPVNELRLMDINHDNYVDIITCGTPVDGGSGMPINLLFNRGSEPITGVAERFVINPGRGYIHPLESQFDKSCQDLRALDLDSDGVLDLVALYSDRFTLLRGSKEGSDRIFDERTVDIQLDGSDRLISIPEEFLTQFQYGSLAVGDFDLDHYPDLYLGRARINIETFEELSLSIPDSLFLQKPNLPEAYFTDVVRSGETSGSSRSSGGVVNADFNHDGKPDLLVTYLRGQPSLYLNSSSSTRRAMQLSLDGFFSALGGVEIQVKTQADPPRFDEILVGSGRSGTALEDQLITLPSIGASEEIDLVLSWPRLNPLGRLTQRRYGLTSDMSPHLSAPVCEISISSIMTSCGGESEGCCIDPNPCRSTSLRCDDQSNLCVNCIGEEGCICDDQEECSIGTKCDTQGNQDPQDDLCVECVGTEGCTCAEDSDCGSSSLRCDARRCVDCTGEAGCACDAQDECSIGTKCDTQGTQDPQVDLCVACVGTVGCTCANDSDCGSSSLRCDARRCVDCTGEAGCACEAQEVCGIGTKCDTQGNQDPQDDLCVECVGEPDCTCATNLDCGSSSLRCSGQRCVDCTGEAGCACREQNVCNTTLKCQDTLCVDCEGENGCTCAENGQCVSGNCDQGICLAAPTTTKANPPLNLSHKVDLTLSVTKTTNDPRAISCQVKGTWRGAGNIRDVIDDVSDERLREPDVLSKITLEVGLTRSEHNQLSQSASIYFEVVCGIYEAGHFIEESANELEFVFNNR